MQVQNPHPRKIPNILVTGTPGTGKTTFCQLINQSLNFNYIPVGKLIIDNHLYDNWNKEFDVPEYSEEKLVQYLSKTYKIEEGGLLIDFHSPDAFPTEYIDLIILMRCQNETLYKRLEERGYKPEKIRQNIECQIFDEIKYDIEEYFGNSSMVLELRNEKKEEMQNNLQVAVTWLLEYKAKAAQMQTQ